MKRFIPGVTKHPLMAAFAVVGALSVGAASVGAAYANPDHDHGGRGGRCAKLMEMDKKLTQDQVRDIVAGRLASHGDGNLKVGKVSSKDGVTSIDLVTASGSLVTTRQISQKTGMPQAMSERCEQRMAAKDGDGKGKHHGFRGHKGGRGGMGLGLAAYGGERGDLNLTVDQVKKIAEANLILANNPRLKVGSVKEKDADTITVNIVTVDDALVVSRDVDRDTGRIHRDHGGKPAKPGKSE